jgi:hypothetical protein
MRDVPAMPDCKENRWNVNPRECITREETPGCDKEGGGRRAGDFAQVDHSGTQLIIAGNFSHGKNVFRSKEISDDTSRSTQGGRRKVGRDTGTKVPRFVIE